MAAAKKRHKKMLVRDRRLTVYLAGDHYHLIERAAAKRGLSLSAYLVSSCINLAEIELGLKPRVT